MLHRRFLAHLGVQQLGDAEVEQARLVVGLHQHVARLQVAMDDQLRMRVRHRPAQLEEQLEPRAQRRIALQPFAQSDAVDQFHREPRASALVDAAVDEQGDVRMTQAAEHLALAAELGLHCAAVHAEPDALERDLLHEAAFDALGEPDRSHAAAAEKPQEPPRADAFAAGILLLGRQQACGELVQGTVEPRVVAGIQRQQALQQCVQGRVATAGLLQPCLPLPDRPFERGAQEPDGARIRSLSHGDRGSRRGPGAARRARYASRG